MGLGKTVQTIAALALRGAKYPGHARPPSMVVCPAILVGHWTAEVRKFVPPSVLEALKLSELIDNGLRARAKHGRDKTESDGVIMWESDERQADITYVEVVGKY